MSDDQGYCSHCGLTRCNRIDPSCHWPCENAEERAARKREESGVWFGAPAAIFKPGCPDHPRQTSQNEDESCYCAEPGCEWAWKSERLRKAEALLEICGIHHIGAFYEGPETDRAQYNCACGWLGHIYFNASEQNRAAACEEAEHHRVGLTSCSTRNTREICPHLKPQGVAKVGHPLLLETMVKYQALGEGELLGLPEKPDIMSATREIARGS